MWTRRKSGKAKTHKGAHLHDAHEEEGDRGDGEHVARGHEAARAAAQLEDCHVAVERDEQHEERREAVQKVRERREEQRAERRQVVVDATAEIPVGAPVGEKHRQRAVREGEREHQRVDESDQRVHERRGGRTVTAATQRYAAHEVRRESEEHHWRAEVQRSAVVQQEHCGWIRGRVRLVQTGSPAAELFGSCVLLRRPHHRCHVFANLLVDVRVVFLVKKGAQINKIAF